MTAYWRFTVDCPRCGGQLTPLTGSKTHPRANLETKAVAQCATCRDTWILTVTMTSELNRRTATADHDRRPPAARDITHGTFSGYRAHFRRNETPCDPCKAANALRRQAQRVAS